MSLKEKITISADIIATLKGMDNVVNKMKNGLSEGVTKIDFTKGIGLSIDNLFKKFKDHLSEFNRYTKDGLDIKNSSKAISEGQKIIDIFKEIQDISSRLQNKSEIDLKKIFSNFSDVNTKEIILELEKVEEIIEQINSKKLKISQNEDDVKTLRTEIEQLQKEIKDTGELQIKTDKATKDLEKFQNDFDQLKNKIKKNIEIQINTANKEKATQQNNIKTIENNINNNKDYKKISQKGRSILYNGFSLSQLKKKTKEVKEALSEKEIETGIKVLQNYFEEIKKIKNSQETINSIDKTLKNLRKTYASFDNIDNTKLGETLSKLGFSIKDINKVNNALQSLNLAIEEEKNAQDELNKAEAENEKIQKNIDTKSKAIKQKTEEVEQLKQAISDLTKKIDLEKISKAFKSVDIDFTPDLLNDTQSIQSLKKELNELDRQDLNNLVNELKEIGLNADDTRDFLRKLGIQLDDVEDKADSLKAADQEIANLKSQVMDFFSISNTIQLFKRTVQSAFETVKELDATMTEAAVVTNFSVGDMWSQLSRYSEEATKLGVTINDLYGATTLYYQQGLNINEAMDVGIETMKMARIAAMDSVEATQLMTAALRGFNMELNEVSAQRVNDVYSELAAITAADTAQIGTAMSKTASIAASANMEFETTAAFLAQIIETTQESPETAGTAMKTIIARFTEVKELFSEGQLTGKDSEGEAININKIDAALKTVGISLTDFLTGTKGLDDILLELASKWDSLDIATQRYIATTAAGSRLTVNRLLLAA